MSSPLFGYVLFLCCLYSFLLFIFVHLIIVFFFFKQKTAYEMRISDWSSDVCSSDLSARSPMCCARWPIRPRPTSTPCASVSPTTRSEIGRASCRERVCQYV